MLGMEHVEGTPRTFLQSIQWASETLTTTGYGADNHWNHPAVALFVILSQFLGLFLVFLIFPIFVLPYVEEQFEVRLQRAATDGRKSALLPLWPGNHHLPDEQIINVENRIKFSRLSAGTLAGAHPWRSQALDRTGAKVVAMERGHDVLVEFDDDFLVRRDDALFVCGSINSLERYQREFQVTTAPAVRALTDMDLVDLAPPHILKVAGLPVSLHDPWKDPSP